MFWGAKDGDQLALEPLLYLLVLGLEHDDLSFWQAFVDLLVHRLVFDNLLGNVQGLAGALLVQNGRSVGRLETSIQRSILASGSSNKGAGFEKVSTALCVMGEDIPFLTYRSWFSSRDRL